MNARRFARWFDGGHPGAFGPGPESRALEPRVRRAFVRVLAALEREEFDRFLRARPTLVCEPGARGSTFRLPPFGAARQYVTVMYLSPIIARLGRRSLVDLVAHEVAHVVLGHANPLRYPGAPADERSADALVIRWGFGASYAKNGREVRRRSRAK